MVIIGIELSELPENNSGERTNDLENISGLYPQKNMPVMKLIKKGSL
jgi:hypothetical protein